MGIFSSMRNLFGGQESEDRILLKRCLDANLYDIRLYEKNVKQFTDKMNAAPYINSPAFKFAENERNRFRYSLFEAEKMRPFIRENTPEDIEYRMQVLPHFSEKLQNLLPETSKLRFHGTPIYFAEEILKNGGLCSSADRFDGYIKSTDMHGEFSVSDIKSLSRTMDYYMDVDAHQRCLPCGCLFVVDGEGQTPEQYKASVMNSIDFNKEPGRLCAVVSTPENQSHLRQWLMESGFSPDFACTFEDFLLEIEQSFRNVSREMADKPSLSDRIQSASNRANTLHTGKVSREVGRFDPEL